MKGPIHARTGFRTHRNDSGGPRRVGYRLHSVRQREVGDKGRERRGARSAATDALAANSQVEINRWPTRARAPLIEVL
jgi:hypothetical protein